MMIAFLLFCGTVCAGEKLTIAAASDLQFVMKEVVSLYRQRSETDIQVVYGSSGNLFSQIKAGAPYDLFFSADSAYPKLLKKEGMTADSPKPYATGRIVLWSRKDSGISVKKGMKVLLDPKVKKIAIANPRHAPYGKRARESLKYYGLWEKIQGKIVLGENISQTAQFVHTGNAQVGIIALSLALAPEMKKEGAYLLIPARSHKPQEQSFVILKGVKTEEAYRFAEFTKSKEARRLFKIYGLSLPAKEKDLSR
ncbi:MAG: molybdate ABC transporter substrate-binding protein [Armatimonadetes bacterium]|nr:molybdate ABC transporter substrate-binding protein [Armatimonadota bacterium]